MKKNNFTYYNIAKFFGNIRSAHNYYFMFMMEINAYFYWSSTEAANNAAWYQDFYSGSQGSESKENEHLVRAIRAF
jgi:hypothetical protein